MAFYSKENVVIFKTDNAKKMKFKTESVGCSDSLDSGREKTVHHTTCTRESTQVPA